DLPMAAEIEVAHAPGDEGMEEFLGPHAVALEHLEDAGESVAATHAVDQDADLDTAAYGVAQGFGEHAAGGVVVEDIGGEADAVLGGPDGFQHGGIGFLAIDQGADAVAGQERQAGDAADEAWQAVGLEVGGGDRLLVRARPWSGR